MLKTDALVLRLSLAIYILSRTPSMRAPAGEVSTASTITPLAAVSPSS